MALALTFPVWITVNFLGQPDNGVIVASYVGSFLMAGGYLAISAAISATTGNQVIAFVVSVVICFLFTISGASLAASALRDQEIAAEAMHSGQSSQDRHVILAKFATGTLHAVVAPQVLDEGVDVPAADLAIILAASRSRRQMVQRMGRVLRCKHDGRRARFVVVFVEGTVEDPAMGAHEGFLAEVTGVAEAVRTFASRSSMADVEAFVGDLGIANAKAGVLVDRRVVQSGAAG